MDDQAANDPQQSYDVNNEETKISEATIPPQDIAEEYGQSPPDDPDALHNSDTFDSPVGDMSTNQIDTQSAWQEHQQEETAVGNNQE